MSFITHDKLFWNKFNKRYSEPVLRKLKHLIEDVKLDLNKWKTLLCLDWVT